MKKVIAILAAALMLTACQSNQEPEPAQEEAQVAEQTRERQVRRTTESRPAPPPPRAEPAPRRGDPERAMPQLRGAATEEGYGLTLILDGSSPEAFQDSLEMVAADATPEQYSRLNSALQYLRVYSPAAMSGGMDKIYESLDGMTGEDVIREAARLQAQRLQR